MTHRAPRRRALGCLWPLGAWVEFIVLGVGEDRSQKRVIGWALVCIAANGQSDTDHRQRAEDYRVNMQAHGNCQLFRVTPPGYLAK